MSNKLSTVCLAVVLAGTLLWGRCVSCFAAQTASNHAHDCCKPPVSDHCGKNTPKRCTQDPTGPAEYQKAQSELSQLIGLSEAPAFGAASYAEPATSAAPEKLDAFILLHSPPELYLLNSTLLI